MSTIAQRAREAGFKANLAIRGRQVRTDTKTAGGAWECLKVLVQDEPILPDSTDEAQTEKPVYSRLSALAGAVADPRAVTIFTEAGGRSYSVIYYDEKASDAVSWQWFCEAGREEFAAGQPNT